MSRIFLGIFLVYLLSLLVGTFLVSIDVISFSACMLGISILGVFSFLKYLESKQLPDIRKEVEKAFENRDKEINNLKSAMSKYEMAKSQSNFRF